MKELKEPRPCLQRITFLPAEHKSDGLSTGGAEICDETDVRQVCKVGQVPVLGVMMSSFPHQRRQMGADEAESWNTRASKASEVMIVISAYTAKSKRSTPRMVGEQMGEVTLWKLESNGDETPNRANEKNMEKRKQKSSRVSSRQCTRKF